MYHGGGYLQDGVLCNDPLVVGIDDVKVPEETVEGLCKSHLVEKMAQSEMLCKPRLNRGDVG